MPPALDPDVTMADGGRDAGAALFEDAGPALHDAGTPPPDDARGDFAELDSTPSAVAQVTVVDRHWQLFAPGLALDGGVPAPRDAGTRDEAADAD